MNYNNRRYNNNKRRETENESSKYNPSKREINSLLDFSSEDIVFDEEVNSSQKNNKKQNFANDEWDNPICKILKRDAVYDRNDVYNILVKSNGLVKIIDDLKTWKKNPKQKKPNYIYYLLRNIVFASALPDAINKLTSKDEYGEAILSKKDLDYLMDEILSFLSSSYDQRLIQQYGNDSVESMRKAYTNILYKLNKKKVKKFKDIKDDISESMVKQLVILSAGEDLHTIYRFLKFLYNNANDFTFSKKILLKIFKICYGKDNIPEIIKYLMLERKQNNLSEKATQLSVILDQIIRDELEDMPKKSIEKIINSYISERKHQEKNGKIARRFGDRRAIHPDDYPKLTKVCEDIEENDFSIVQYLR